MPPKKAALIKGRPLSVEKDIIEGRILAQLRNAGFRIQKTDFAAPYYDAVAENHYYGKTKTYGIHIKFEPNGPALTADDIQNYRSPGRYDEQWIIAEMFDWSAKEYAEKEFGTFLFTLNEFELAFRDYPPKQAAPRGKAAKAVKANYAEFNLTTKSLILLLDQKIAALQKERPNSDEKIAERDGDIKQYMALREKLANLGAVAADYHAGKAKEAALTQAVKLFADGVRLWWTKNPEKICQRAYDMSMFFSAITLCSMVGANGNVAVVISAALVGGKPVSDVLKKLGKKLFG